MAKQVNRRQFLKLSGAVAATLALADLGFNEQKVQAKTKTLKINSLKPTPTVCPYCAVGCGILVYANESKDDVVYSEGDPDNPINQGSLCSKGGSLRQLYTTEKRIEKPRYRAPGSNKWEEKSWEWMYEQIAKRVKETRDRTFEEKKDGIYVNRTESIVSLGGAALDNEETHLITKLMRAGLGLTYIEHQARI